LWPLNSREAIIEKKKKPSYNCAEKQIESKKEKREKKNTKNPSYLSCNCFFIIFHINVK
jgi:NADH:ubiquinone oxidoreductase subunit 3 (subunit A)